VPFKDRSDAGRQLAAALAEYKDQRPVILALPRGGVPVAVEIATAFNAPLDLILVRKIGVPFQPELAMGAVVDGGAPLIVRNESVIRLAGIDEPDFEAPCDRELGEIERRRQRYLVTVNAWRSRAGQRSSSTMASPPVRPPVRHCERSVSAAQSTSSLRCRWRRLRASLGCARRLMTSSASRITRPSERSATIIPILRGFQTKKWPKCSATFRCERQSTRVSPLPEGTPARGTLSG
jgi:Phosphoribosyl transferase domain